MRLQHPLVTLFTWSPFVDCGVNHGICTKIQWPFIFFGDLSMKSWLVQLFSHFFMWIIQQNKMDVSISKSLFAIVALWWTSLEVHVQLGWVEDSRWWRFLQIFSPSYLGWVVILPTSEHKNKCYLCLREILPEIHSQNCFTNILSQIFNTVQIIKPNSCMEACKL